MKKGEVYVFLSMIIYYAIDGLAIIASLSLTADDFTEETYRKIIIMMKQPNIFQMIYLYLSAPIFGLITLFQFITYGDRKCPFKANKKPLSDDTKIALSKNYSLKDFENFPNRKKSFF